MKVAEYTTLMGRLKICETGNWDIEEIRNRYKRVCNISGTQLSREISKYRSFIKFWLSISNISTRIMEIRNKLKGIYDN